jgi:hypothetical protein
VQVDDLSVSGCFLRGWTASPGRKVDLILPLSDGGPPLVMRIEVVREDPARGGVGVRIWEELSVGAEARLARMVRQFERRGLAERDAADGDTSNAR